MQKVSNIYITEEEMYGKTIGILILETEDGTFYKRKIENFPLPILPNRHEFIKLTETESAKLKKKL